MMLRKIFILPVIILVCILEIPTLASGHDALSNAAYYGIYTIIPPLVAIVLAFISKNVVFSLFFGTLSGCVMLEVRGMSIVSGSVDGFLRVTTQALLSMADVWNAAIMLQVLTIGGLIALVTRMGGINAIARALSKIAKTPRSAQFATWLMGLCIFFDDYANSLTVGPTMRPVTDKMKISRERLAFIVDATSAPLSGMALISTWIAYEVGLINDVLSSYGITENAYGIFISSLPFRFYNILIFALVLVTIYMLRDFGPMYKAEYRARTTGQLSRPGAMLVKTKSESIVDEESTSIWFAIIPFGTLIFGAFIGFFINGYNSVMSGGDEIAKAAFANGFFNLTALQMAFGASNAATVLFQAAFIACVVALIMGISKKMFSIKDGITIFVDGVQSMNITCVILLFAWSLSAVIKELGTAVYMVEHLSTTIPYWLLPALIFILGSIISFATGTSYGTMGIIMPLAIPLAWDINPDYNYLVLNIGAVLTGAIFGDHCSPISDTTILSSMGASCDMLDHVNTQILYAFVIGAVSVLTYIIAGLGLNVWFVLIIGIILVILIVRLFGKKVPDFVP